MKIFLSILVFCSCLYSYPDSYYKKITHPAQDKKDKLLQKKLIKKKKEFGFEVLGLTSGMNKKDVIYHYYKSHKYIASFNNKYEDGRNYTIRDKFFFDDYEHFIYFTFTKKEAKLYKVDITLSYNIKKLSDLKNNFDTKYKRINKNNKIIKYLDQENFIKSHTFWQINEFSYLYIKEAGSSTNFLVYIDSRFNEINNCRNRWDCM